MCNEIKIDIYIFYKHLLQTLFTFFFRLCKATNYKILLHKLVGKSIEIIEIWTDIFLDHYQSFFVM